MVNTISSYTNHGITLSTSYYSSPLVIYGTGAVVASDGTTAIYAATPLPGFTLVNFGLIKAGDGPAGSNGVAPVAGGLGVELSGAQYVTNYGSIFAGAGGAGFGGGAGAAGGMGASLTNIVSFYNSGTLDGGAGGGSTGGNVTGGAGGAGGDGLDVVSGQYGYNSGLVLGGAGGAGGAAGVFDGGAGGAGGIGASLVGAISLTNKGMVEGGAGGAGGYGSSVGGAGGAGGDGSDTSNSGKVNNAGQLEGGQGGAGGNSDFQAGAGGAGGVGISIANSTSLMASGGITGGAGGAGGTVTALVGYGGAGGAGGAGVVLSGSVLLTNTGDIMGGNGGAGGVGPDGGNGGAGGAGVYLSGAILIDSGVIEGGAGGAGGASDALGTAGTAGLAGDAVEFGAVAGTLVVDPGGAFIGAVVANAAVADELAVAGVSSSVLSGIGTEFLNFTDIDFARGARWAIEGNVAGLSGAATIGGFTVHDTIILDSFTAVAADTTYVAGVGLELTDALGNQVTLHISEPNASTMNFVETDTAGGTAITYVACFAKGTRILMASGRRLAVEELAEGQAVQLADGTAAPVMWVGRRTLDVRRHPRPESVRPVLIEAGALGGGVPWRDLLVSPDHGMFLDGHLIPAKALVNGGTIRQTAPASVTYYHVELPVHAVMIAEGAAAESYLETGNRGAFENGEAALTLHPDFAQGEREARGCAPFVEAGPVVEKVRQRLLDLAAMPTTDDPALRVSYVRGAAVIESRCGVPGELWADPRDRRRLGVKVAALLVGGRAISLDHPALVEGWHAVEPDGRWTDGRAVIPAGLLQGGVVEVVLGSTMRYRAA